MRRRDGRGFSKLEFALVLAVIGIAAYLALVGLQQLEEFVEMRAVEGTLRNAETGLRYALAERINRGEEKRIAELVGSNPVSLLAKEPDGYVGEVVAERQVPPGSWAYDRNRRELCYRPRLSGELQLEGGEQLLRWRIEAADDTTAGPPTWARLVPVSRYRWF